MLFHIAILRYHPWKMALLPYVLLSETILAGHNNRNDDFDESV